MQQHHLDHVINGSDLALVCNEPDSYHPLSQVRTKDWPNEQVSRRTKNPNDLADQPALNLLAS